MDFDPEEQEIIDLLTKLRNQGGTYPKKLLTNRRQVFLGQMASVGMGLGVGERIKPPASPPKTGMFPHLSGLSASSLIETILILAIVVQASVVAYAYRDKLVDIINTLSASSPSIPTDDYIPVTGASPTETAAFDTPTSTISETPTASPSSTMTPLPPTSMDNHSINPNNNDTSPGVTPRPTNGNNGNHYGQTPKPERTKENNAPKATKDTGNGNSKKKQ